MRQAVGLEEQQHLRNSVLDPVERASEVIFGVLMAMSITGSISVVNASRGQWGDLLVAAFSCNIAWGLTDAVMYLVRAKTARYRRRALVRQVRDASTDEQALRLLGASLPAPLQQFLRAEGLGQLRQRLLSSPEPSSRLDRKDLQGALGIFVLVVLSTMPVALPFWLMPDSPLAMRISNLLGVATLFLCGHLLGRHAEGSPWGFGLAMSAIGSLLVGIIVALGG